jgi:acetyl esterase/lipase
MSPLYGDLAGLPPLLLQCGSEEMLRDDSVRLAEKARAAGVEVAFEEWDEMVHVWHLFADRLADGREALARIGEFARAKTSPHGEEQSQAPSTLLRPRAE